MTKVVLIAMLTGFLVAMTIGVSLWYGFHHGAEPLPRLAAWITIFLWPTVFVIPLDVSENQIGFVLFAISTVTNGIFYGIFGWVITASWKYVLSSKGRRERAEGWWPGKTQDP